MRTEKEIREMLVAKKKQDVKLPADLFSSSADRVVLSAPPQGLKKVTVRMHDGDVVFDGADSLQKLARDMQNVCALRKALDMATDALRYYRDKDYETDCTVAMDALNEISETMKGDK